MTSTTMPHWHAMRNDDSRQVEDVLRRGGFPLADAYRYNSASIRVRVIDPRFENLSHEQRDGLIEPLLDTLPASLQSDIVTLLTVAPSELISGSDELRTQLRNLEFEEPSRTQL